MRNADPSPAVGRDAMPSISERYADAVQTREYTRRWLTVGQIQIPEECRPSEAMVAEERARVAARLAAGVPHAPECYAMECADGSFWACEMPELLLAYREVDPSIRAPVFVYPDPVTLPDPVPASGPALPPVDVAEVRGCRARATDEIPDYPGFWHEAEPDPGFVRVHEGGPQAPSGRFGSGRYPLGEYLTRLDGTVFRVFGAELGVTPPWAGHSGGYVTAVVEVVPHHRWRHYRPDRLDLLRPGEERRVAWRHHGFSAESCRSSLAFLLEALPSYLLDCYFQGEYERGLSPAVDRRLETLAPRGPRAWGEDPIEFD